MKRAPALSNQDIFMYALYRLQGAGQFVDVEDIYVECWHLSPSRFGWRKHGFPNYKVAAKALQTIEATHPSYLLKTASGLERQLSSEGLQWVRTCLPMFNALDSGNSKAPKQRRLSHKIVSEIRHSRAFETWSGDGESATKLDVAEALHCSPDSPRSIWRQRLETLSSAALDNEASDVQLFAAYLRDKHPEWFGLED
jgi:hypothetical protein